MKNCYLFTHALEKNRILSMRLDNDGQIDMPLVHRCIDDVKQMQVDAKTTIVLPTSEAALYQVELPKLADAKLRAAIPYALEEQLAQNVTTLHFAYDVNFYQDGHYLVVVIEKERLSLLMALLEKWSISYHDITLDWFALTQKESCVIKDDLLIYHHDFKGGLSGVLAAKYLKTHDKTGTVYFFSDSSLAIDSLNESEKIDEAAMSWVAKRLNSHAMINLCQGDFQQKHHQNTTRFWYMTASILTAIMVVSWFVANLVILFSLNKELSETNDKIAVIYHQFFPDSRQVVSPKFRVQQLLKTDHQFKNKVLWDILSRLGHVLKQHKFTVEQLNFQHNTVSLTLFSTDFLSLENIQKQLEKQNLHVVQHQAASNNGQVIANLELSL